MKVVVCGSREFDDPAATMRKITARLNQLPRSAEIINGGAFGTDTWADATAWGMGFKTTTIRADWERHGRRAGILRNIEMLDLEPDLVIAFWNGHSKGTKHTIDEAERRGIPVEIIL